MTTKAQWKEYRRTYYVKHRDRMLAEKKSWLASLSPDEKSAHLQRRRVTRKPLTDAQKLAHSKRDEAYRLRYPERAAASRNEATKAHAKRDRKANPEKWYIKDSNHQNRRRALKGVGEVTLQEWQGIKESFGNKCAYCLQSGVKLTQDHVVALADGGEHAAANVVPACHSCNSRKGDRGVLSMLNHLARKAA